MKRSSSSRSARRSVMDLLVVAIGLFTLMCTPNQTLAGEKINAAVVAGFIQTFQEISTAYEEKSGVKVEPAFSSAGRLYSQIINQAPYDIFLSADRERPELLYSKGVCEKPFIYAIGQVVLWSSNKEFCTRENWRVALGQSGIRKIAIVNPKTGVHGERAQKALQDAGLWNSLAPKLVYAQDMAQAFQYATEGAVDAAFCPLALARTEKGRRGCYYEMNDAPDVIYSACVLKNAKKHNLALDFAGFLVSSETQKIMKKYGYKQIQRGH